jgi:hypothetical protein
MKFSTYGGVLISVESGIKRLDANPVQAPHLATQPQDRLACTCGCCRRLGSHTTIQSERRQAQSESDDPSTLQ